MALQLYADGGFTRAGGSYAVQAVAYYRHCGVIQRRMVGHAFTHVPDAKSAFQMEIMGLDKAVELMFMTFAHRCKRQRVV